MNFKRSDNNCPLCEKPSVLIEEGLIDRKDINSRICTDCQFVFQDPMRSQEELDEYYRQEYREKGRFAYASCAEYHTKKEAAILARYELLKSYIGPGQVLLDLGCATGRWMQQVSAHGVDIDAVEPYAPFAEYARQWGNVKVGYAETVELPRKYDGIFMFHLLEHIRYPDVVLRKLKSHLLEGGRLFIEVPNLQDAFNAFIFPKEVKHFVSPHLWTFTPKSLEMLLEECGLTVTRCIPYQRIGLFTHLYHAFDEGKTVNSVKGKTIRVSCAPQMRDILSELDMFYRQRCVQKNMADTLLMVAVNA